MKLHYPADHEAVARIADDQRDDFEKWFGDVDAEHAKLGRPYGEGSLAEITGVECWIGYFMEGYSAADAMAEDLSYAG